MSQGSAVTGRRILRALWLQDEAAAVARAAPLAAAIVANYRERFGAGPTWQELCLKMGIPPMGVEFPLRGSLEWITWRAGVTELIPELVATGWLADVRGVERSLNVGPRWAAAGASWLEHPSAVPNVRAYFFRHGPRPGVAPSPTP
ncbi:MAG: hypothetical protein M0T72_06930 [Candidatus Dormibacteraeota bacterium]|nr:hypothetical protein [Candidatus Dormibacteraeota bacterium]